MLPTRRAALAAVSLVTLSCLAGCATAPSIEADATVGAGAAPPPAPTRFVVHEWGTFITMQGSDGVALEGVQNEVEKLPAFVHAATREAPSPFRDYGDASRSVPVRAVTGKGETPVLYFYADAPLRARVRVDFPNGLLTQWYPQAAEHPTIVATHERPVDLRALGSTSLLWDLDLVAEDATLLPSVAATDPWGWARVPGALNVRTRHGGETERYVFYRGLGQSALPLVVNGVMPPAGDPAITCVTNTAAHAVEEAFLLEMGATEGRFQRLGSFGSQEKKQIHFAQAPRAKAAVIGELEAAMRAALVGQGLYAAEADAMVRTWSHAWFASEGRRVLYLVPRPILDAVWPLHVEPAPTELARVLVGRLEYLTPHDESEIAKALADRQAPHKRDQATRALARRGRFLEPVLRRMLRRESPAEVRASAREMLSAFGG
jgi:hypothetical protein